MHVRNLEYPFPLQIGAQIPFSTTRQLNGSFNGLYLFFDKLTVRNDTGLRHENEENLRKCSCDLFNQTAFQLKADHLRVSVYLVTFVMTLTLIP